MAETHSKRLIDAFLRSFLFRFGEAVQSFGGEWEQINTAVVWSVRWENNSLVFTSFKSRYLEGKLFKSMS